MSRRTAWVVLLLVALGGLVRVGYLWPPIMDSDQAVFGLQSRHILLGEFRAFSWGYAYIGTLQSFLDALAFLLFGASRVVLNAVPLVLSLLFVPLTYRLGREIGGVRVGLFGAVLVALAPPYLALYGVWARHGYMDSLVLGSLILLLALELGHRPLEEAKELRLFALLGLVGGVAWWTNFLSLYYLIPAALFLLLRDWRCVARTGPWVALAFFLLGGAPFWLWNLPHALGTFRMFKGGGDLGEAPVQLLRVVTEGVPAIVGARGSHATTNFVPVLSPVVMALYAVAFVWLAGRELLRGWRRQRIEPGPALLLLFLATAGLLLSASRYGEEITAFGTKRYLLPLYSALPLLYAVFLARVWETSRLLCVALLSLPLALHVYGNVVSYPVFRGEIPTARLARAQDQVLFHFLKTHGLTRVYVTNYWLAPRLTFDAREEIIFAQPSRDRYPPYTRLVDAAPRVAYLFAAGASGPFAAYLRGIGAAFERTEVGPYEVYYGFRPPSGIETLVSVPQRGWAASASSTATPLARAFDRDIDTSWYSGETQRPGLFFQLDLGRPRRVGKVVVLAPRPSIGFPRGYRIALSRDGEAWVETADVTATPWSFDWDRGQPRMGPPDRVVSVFQPQEVRYIRVQQTGRDPKWWWAIGELFVYGPAADGAIRPARALVEHLESGGAYEAQGRLREAALAYWQAARVDPESETAHARLAALYDRARVPLEGAAPPAVRARSFERLGLWDKAVREYEEEIRQTNHHQHHTDLWRRLLRAYRATGDEAGVRRVEERLAREFSPSVSVTATFDDQIRFLGYHLEPRSLRPGQAFRLTYYWQSLKPTSPSYDVFVHFVRDGRILFQHDHTPLDGAYPTSQWQVGEVIREAFELSVPSDLEPGSYEIVLGLWDPETGRRLDVREATVAHRKDRVVVGHLTIDARS